jgi:hypothetical protein
MVPIDEETVELVDRILTHRSAGRPLRYPRTGKLADFLLTHQGRRGSRIRCGRSRAPAEAGLAVQSDQLRRSLEAVAAKVRRHEETVRRLERARRGPRQ